MLDSILTQYDTTLDETSVNPHKRMFEKYISGLYLPELARIIVTTEDERYKIINEVPAGLIVSYCMDGRYLSFLAGPSDFINTFKEKFNYELLFNEFNNMKNICQAVMKRAVVLTALDFWHFMEKIGLDRIVITVNGSMYRKHPSQIYNVIQELKNHIMKRFYFKDVEDESGKGSTLAACIAPSRKIN